MDGTNKLIPYLFYMGSSWILSKIVLSFTGENKNCSRGERILPFKLDSQHLFYKEPASAKTHPNLLLPISLVPTDSITVCMNLQALTFYFRKSDAVYSELLHRLMPDNGCIYIKSYYWLHWGIRNFVVEFCWSLCLQLLFIHNDLFQCIWLIFMF